MLYRSTDFVVVPIESESRRSPEFSPWRVVAKAGQIVGLADFRILASRSGLATSKIPAHVARNQQLTANENMVFGRNRPCSGATVTQTVPPLRAPWSEGLLWLRLEQITFGASPPVFVRQIQLKYQQSATSQLVSTLEERTVVRTRELSRYSSYPEKGGPPRPYQNGGPEALHPEGPGHRYRASDLACPETRTTGHCLP